MGPGRNEVWSTLDRQAMCSKAEVCCFKLKGEDRHCLLPGIPIAWTWRGVDVSTRVALYGVFDGHGGKQAAEVASKQVPKKLTELLQRAVSGHPDFIVADTSPAAAPDAPPLAPAGAEDCQADCEDLEAAGRSVLQHLVTSLLPEVLHTVFVEVHAEFVEKHKVSGTTATVVALCEGDVVTASVGDSLAFVDTGCAVHMLTANHRLDDNKGERERLLAAGLEVAAVDVDGEPTGPLRVWPGGLAFSRSIGDVRAGPEVLAEPAITHVRVGDAGCRVILASDGLWDAVHSNGAAIAKRVRAAPCRKAVTSLRTYAKERRSSDDLTVVVVDVMPDREAKLPPALTRFGNTAAQKAVMVCKPLEQKGKWEAMLKLRQEELCDRVLRCLRLSSQVSERSSGSGSSGCTGTSASDGSFECSSTPASSEGPQAAEAAQDAALTADASSDASVDDVSRRLVQVQC